MNDNEAYARTIINRLLKESNWNLEINPNVRQEVHIKDEITDDKFKADYILDDEYHKPLCVVEAKAYKFSKYELLSHVEQLRNYMAILQVRYGILSNGKYTYFWDNEINKNIELIDVMPTYEKLKLEIDFPQSDETVDIDDLYLTESQYDGVRDLNKQNVDRIVKENHLIRLRPYQIDAINAVKKAIENGKKRFLLEMATGTGKTSTSMAIVKLFMQSFGVKKVLFLVDRIELEDQAKNAFDAVLKNDYKIRIFKEDKRNWKSADILISTVQSFVVNNRYKKIFQPDDFQLVISDEAHRSLGYRSRKVFEYFVGYKLGLTATPKNFLKGINYQKLAKNNPKELDRRNLKDTYTTFGCYNLEDDEPMPTYRYTLEDGHRDGYLILPKVLDASTEITNKLFSEEGFSTNLMDDEGNMLEEEIFRIRDYERKFFSDETNKIFCETILNHAMKDPYTNEIGKTLIFCVSQTHAAKITHLLNGLASERGIENKQLDFAVQVTSMVDNSQELTVNFRNNNLNGNSNVNELYTSSKTRICVTVGMMSTGYDCPDLLNVVMLRPIYSPSDFIQIKGRGTRRCDFKQFWKDKKSIPYVIESNKKEFYLFDFFKNYHYFDSEYDYDKKLTLSMSTSDGGGIKLPGEEAHYEGEDIFVEMNTYLGAPTATELILYPSLLTEIQANEEIKQLEKQGANLKIRSVINENYLNNPESIYTNENISRSIGSNRYLTTEEIYEYSQGNDTIILDLRELIDHEFDLFDDKTMIEENMYNDLRFLFEAYATNEEFRNLYDNKKFGGGMNVHPAGRRFSSIYPSHKRIIDIMFNYINVNVNLERLVYVR